MTSWHWRRQANYFGGKYVDFERATVFCLGHHLTKHKTTSSGRNFGEHGPLGSPLAKPMLPRHN